MAVAAVRREMQGFQVLPRLGRRIVFSKGGKQVKEVFSRDFSGEILFSKLAVAISVIFIAADWQLPPFVGSCIALKGRVDDVEACFRIASSSNANNSYPTRIPRRRFYPELAGRVTVPRVEAYWSEHLFVGSCSVFKEGYDRARRIVFFQKGAGKLKREIPRLRGAFKDIPFPRISLEFGNRSRGWKRIDHRGLSNGAKASSVWKGVRDTTRINFWLTKLHVIE